MSPSGIRIDKFLWHARLAKTRSLAAKLCVSGQVEIAGIAVAKPSQMLKIGDAVTLVHAGRRRRLRVLACGERRGPPAEARALYEETAPAERVDGAPPDWVGLLEDE